MSAVRLTKRVIDQATPSAKPRFLWDSELRGFGLRIEPTGTKTYVLRYRLRSAGPSGSKRFLTVGRHGPLTADQARERAKAVLGAVSLGQDPAADLKEKKAQATFGEIAQLFLTEHVGKKRKPRTQADYTSLLDLYALPKLARRKATEITRAELATLHAELSDRPYRANRLLAVIGSLYSFAEQRDLVPEHCNPARRIEKFREEGRERFLSLAELQRLGAALIEAETVGIPWTVDTEQPKAKHLPKPEKRVTLLDPHTTAAIRLLLFTGARLREILTLRWAHVDLERGLLLLPDSKTGRKTIVLNSAAYAVLKDLPQSGDFVIAGKAPDRPRTDLNKPWRLVCGRAKLTDVRLHDLRHTFASVGAGASLGLPIVGKLLGHSQPQTTARYAHLDADPVRLASNIIGSQLAAALKGSGKVPAGDAATTAQASETETRAPEA